MSQLLTKRYQLLQKMKPGGMSIIWKALDLNSQRLVVLKFPSPGLSLARKHIQREATAYQALGHIDGLVRFVGYEENPEHELGPFLAVEFLSGQTLNERLLKRDTFSERQICQIGRSLCRVVEKLHAFGVTHRDISTNNIMLLEESNEVRLIDLGLALVQRPNGEYEPYYEGRVGTRDTRAPEISESYPGDKRSDIYSLGQVLYQLANDPETPGQELSGLDPNATSHVSNELSKVIVRCRKASPEHRYQTARDLDKALRNIPIKTVANKIAVRVPIAGALLLAGAVYSFTRPSQIPTPNPPTTQPATITAQTTIKTPEPASTPSSAPSPEEKPRRNPTETTKKAKATKVVTQASNDDDEIEAAARANLLKLATEPTPIATPKPIEIRVITEKK